MSWNKEFDSAFHPKAVAFVGATETVGRGGHRQANAGGAAFMKAYMKQGFPGKIYPVNLHATDVLGLKAYPNLRSLPEKVDLVVVCVPRSAVFDVLEECGDVGCRNVHVFTAGFAETATEEGRALEAKLREVATRRGLNVVGPNGFGLVYVPAAKMAMFAVGSFPPGNVAFLSQSGGWTLQALHYGLAQGLRYSKIISYGNGTVMDAGDLLEYLGQDTDTGIIGMYLEGVRDGKRFFEVAKDVNLRKPIVIWKQGSTDAGVRAISSHTGVLAGGEQMWRAFFKQTGATRVGALEEFMDFATTHATLRPLPRGNRVGLIVYTGGYSVVGAELCENAGLIVPSFSDDIQKALAEFVPSAGNSVRNPVDAEFLQLNPAALRRTLEAVAADPGVDTVVCCQNLDYQMQVGPEVIKSMGENMVEFARQNKAGKPFIAVLDIFGANKEAREEQARITRELTEAGALVHRTLARGAKALGHLARYVEFLDSRK